MCSQMGCQWGKELAHCFRKTVAIAGGSLLDVITCQKLVTTWTDVMFTERAASEAGVCLMWSQIDSQWRQLDPMWSVYRTAAKEGKNRRNNYGVTICSLADRICVYLSKWTSHFSDSRLCSPPRGGSCMSPTYWRNSTLNLEMASTCGKVEQPARWYFIHRRSGTSP